MLASFLIIAFALLHPALAQAEEYKTSDTSAYFAFDGTRGGLWLGPQSSARRVGASLVLEQGHALWAHPTAAATLTMGERDIELESGGLVGLDLATGELDLFLGRGQAHESGRTWAAQAPARIFGQGPMREQLSYGEGRVPLDAFLPSRPAGLATVLVVGQPGQEEPVTVHPTGMDIHIQTSGLTALAQFKARFDLNDLNAIEALGLLQVVLPQGSQLIEAELELDGERHQGSVRTGFAGAQKSSPFIIPVDPSGESFTRIGFPVFLDGGKEIEFSFQATLPLALSESRAVLNLEACGQPTGEFDLQLQVDSEHLLSSNLELSQEEGKSYSYSQTRAPLSNPILLVLERTATQQLWRGRAPSSDGIFYARADFPSRVEAHPNGRELHILIDRSVNEPAELAELERMLQSLVGSLDPAKDQLALYHYASSLETSQPLGPLPSADEFAALLQDHSSDKQGAPQLYAALASLPFVLPAAAERTRQVIVFSGQQAADSSDSAPLRSFVNDGVSVLVIALQKQSDDERWLLPNLAVQGRHPVVVAAQAYAQLGQLPLAKVAPQEEAAKLPHFSSQAIAGWASSGYLIWGHYLSPPALFDLPGQDTLCLDQSCEQKLDIDLVEAFEEAGLAFSYGSLALAKGQVMKEDLPIAVSPPSSKWQFATLQNQVDSHRISSILKGRDRLFWVEREPFFNNHSARESLPLPSSIAELKDTRLPLGLFGHDPFYIPRLSPPSTPPTLSEVAQGYRSSNTGLDISDSSSLNYIITQVLSYQVDNALSSARQATLLALKETDVAKASAFLEAWHEVAFRAQTQLYTLQGFLWEYGLNARADLAYRDISVTNLNGSNYGRAETAEWYINSNYHRRAEHLLIDSHKLFPDDTTYTTLLINLYEAQKKPELCEELRMELLTRQLERDPSGSEAKMAIKNLVTAKQQRAAQQALDAWSQKVGANISYFVLGSELFMASKDFDAAQQILDQGLQQFPDARRLYAQKINLLLAAEDFQGALEVLDGWRERDQPSLFLTQLSGDLNYQLGNKEAALIAYQQLIEAAPRSALGYIKMGEYFDLEKQRDAANSAYQRAQELDPKNIDLLMRTVASSQDADDYRKAFDSLIAIRTGDYYDPFSAAVNETAYQLLARWHSEASARGDDQTFQEISELSQQLNVDSSGLYSAGPPSYSVRIALVPDPDNTSVIDFSIEEPGGTILSHIVTYNSALGSSLYFRNNKVGTRVYYLPTMEIKGIYTVKMKLQDAGQSTTPVKLYVHRVPKPHEEYWEVHEFNFTNVGEEQSVRFDVEKGPIP